MVGDRHLVGFLVQVVRGSTCPAPLPSGGGLRRLPPPLRPHRGEGGESQGNRQPASTTHSTAATGVMTGNQVSWTENRYHAMTGAARMQSPQMMKRPRRWKRRAHTARSRTSSTMTHCTHTGATGIRTAGAGASAPMRVRMVCAARRACASGVSERADGSETRTASAEESSFLTAVVSGGRRPDMTGTITSLVSSMVGLLCSARGMRPYLSSGTERLPPRKRVSPGMILTSPGFRSSAFRAAGQRKGGDDLLTPADEKRRRNPVLRGGGKQFVVFHDGSQGGGCRGQLRSFPTSLSARGNRSVFPTMLAAGITRPFQSGGRGAWRGGLAHLPSQRLVAEAVQLIPHGGFDDAVRLFLPGHGSHHVNIPGPLLVQVAEQHRVIHGIGRIGGKAVQGGFPVQGNHGKLGRLPLVEIIVRLEDDAAFRIQTFRAHGPVLSCQGTFRRPLITENGGRKKHVPQNPAQPQGNLEQGQHKQESGGQRHQEQGERSC